jgi:hypothetical protein
MVPSAIGCLFIMRLMLLVYLVSTVLAAAASLVLNYSVYILISGPWTWGLLRYVMG